MADSRDRPLTGDPEELGQDVTPLRVPSGTWERALATWRAMQDDLIVAFRVPAAMFGDDPNRRMTATEVRLAVSEWGFRVTETTEEIPPRRARDRHGAAAIRELAENLGDSGSELQWVVGVAETVDLCAPDWREQIHLACNRTKGGDVWPRRGGGGSG